MEMQGVVWSGVAFYERKRTIQEIWLQSWLKHFLLAGYARMRSNARNLLPLLALGVVLTILAAAFNYAVYERRLPAMAIGNPIIERDRIKSRQQNAPLSRIFAGLVNISDDFITDVMYAVRGPGEFPPTNDRIAVVAIDEDSLLRRPWPWSRRDMAHLMDKVSDAKVVGLDLVFPEPDRTSLNKYVGAVGDLFGVELNAKNIAPEIMDNDLYFADAMKNATMVIGNFIHDGEQVGEKIDGMAAPYELRVVNESNRPIEPADVLLKMGDSLIADLALIRATSSLAGEGFVNLFPTPGGSVRTLPLFAHVADTAFSTGTEQARRMYPSLVMEVARIAFGGDGYRLVVRNDIVAMPEMHARNSRGDRHPVREVVVTGGGRDLLSIPLDELGALELGYREPATDYRVYPAWEVLDGMHNGEFTDKIVLVGSTVEGIGFIVSTGMPDADISVVEAHASILSAILKGDFMDSGYQDDYSWQQIFILASGLLVTVAIIFGNLAAGMIASGVCLLLVTIGNYFLFFRRGLDVGVTLPALSTLAVLVVQMIAKYLIVGRERRFIRKAFQLNVSPSILGYLESHPDRLSSLQGEHRDMSVLFTDIRGFTSFSERMTAPDLARFLNEYFTPMSDIVMKNMGTVDKFIGDGLMAFWNAPTDNPDHARDAARSALDMVDKLGELQAGWTSRGLPRIAIGCGINSGPMFAGYMGSNSRKNYTVMGDNVNIASRLEGLNKLYSASILITEATKSQLGHDFTCRVADKVRVSGKAEAVMIYELLGAGPVSDEESEELAAFARVFELYQMREFATAESLLKELVFIRPSPLYKMYLDRLAIYKALPPPQDWDGTFSMMHK